MHTLCVLLSFNCKALNEWTVFSHGHNTGRGAIVQKSAKQFWKIRVNAFRKSNGTIYRNTTKQSTINIVVWILMRQKIFTVTQETGCLLNLISEEKYAPDNPNDLRSLFILHWPVWGYLNETYCHPTILQVVITCGMMDEWRKSLLLVQIRVEPLTFCNKQ